jgi:hypothetical protein
VKNRLLLMIFSLPFAACGTFMSYLLISSIVQSIAVKSWQEVPATIQKADLITSSHTSEGHSKPSTTYKVTAVYNYTNNGQTYTGRRVSIYSGSFSDRTYYQRIYDELTGCKNSGRPFRCYINPSNPSESILYRNLHWQIILLYTIFVLTFGGIGYGLLIGGIVVDQTKQKGDTLKLLYPEEPWRWKKQWNEGRVVSSSKTTMIWVVIFTLFWNLVSTPVIFLLPEELHKGNKAVLFALIFPIVGIGLAVWAIRCILRWRRFGQSILEMETIPGVIGGALKGRLQTRVNINSEDGFHLTISCINRVITGSGKHRTTHNYIRWQDESIIKKQMYAYDPSGSAIPVLFQIPYDSPETNEENPNDKIIWCLDVKASVPGVDYADSFEVPVFRTQKSSKDFVLDKSSISAYEVKHDPAEVLTAAGIRIEQSPAGAMRFYFPMAANKEAGLFLSAFVLIWNVIVYFLFTKHAPLLFGIMFVVIDILLIYWLMDLWFFCSQAEIVQQSLSISKGLLVLRNSRQFDFSGIEGLRITNGMTFMNKVYYQLVLITTDGKKHLIAKGLNSRYLAETLESEIRNILGKEKKL